jgi:RNA polymerase sigma factor (sigma-70 family)
VDDPANVTTFHADKNSATQYLKQAMPKPGDYVVKVTADGDDGKAVAFASANVTVDPLPFTQILISDYQLDGLIHCTYILQHMNDSGQAIAGDDMDYDDTLKVTDMCDELGKPIKFTTTHRGNMFDLKYRLNNPVEPGQPFMVSNLSTIDGLSTKMLRDLGGGEYVATFKHMNGQSGAIRRIELHILPAGAKLISLMPSEIPTKVVDGRVQVFIDAMLRSGGKITSTIRYRLPDGNQKPRDSRQRCRPHFQHINSCRPMACGNSRMNCPPPFAAASYNRAASMKPDFELLQEYVGQGSRPALDQIIRRYLDLVYSAAKRQVRDPTLAQDVTQAVFLVLAKRARTIRRDRAIGGWLLAVTRCAALDAMRRQATRRKRERAAPAAQNREATGDEWAEIAPMLDAELNRLPVLDRDAVVLRYFQDQTFADIGEQLNLTPEAARKRVERAVERLRGFLARRGVTVPTAVIGGAIAAFAVQAAPSHVAAAVGAFVAPSTQSISFAQGAIKMIFWSKTKLIGAIAAILVLGGATIVLPHAWAQQAKPPTTTDAAAALAADAAAAAAAANRPPLADQTMPNAPIAFTLGNQDFVNLDVPIMFRFGFNPPSNVPPNQLAPWVKTSESIRRAVTRDAGVDLSIGETELMKLGTPSREIWPAFLLFNSAVMAPAEADLWDQPDAAILRTTLSVWEKNNGVNNSKPRGADPASYMSAMNLPAAADLPQVYVCRTSAGSLRKIRVVKIDQANKNLRVSIEIKKVAEGPEQ